MNRDYDKNNDHKKRDELLLFILFALCFLFASFTATFSFYRFKTVFKPDPVIDVDENSSATDSSYRVSIEEIGGNTHSKEETSNNNGTGNDNNNNSNDNNGGVTPTKPQDNTGNYSSEVSSTNNHSSEVSSTTHSSETSSTHQSSEEGPEEPPIPPTTKIIQVVYTDGSEIAPTSAILPGWRSNNKELVVTNKSDVNLKYQLVWEVIKNNFVRPQDIVYHVKINGVEVASASLPTTDRIVVNNVELTPLEKHTITVYVEYKNLNIDQSVDMGHTFIGRLIVKNVD